MSFFVEIELTRPIVPARIIGFFASITGFISLLVLEAALLPAPRRADGGGYGEQASRSPWVM